MKKLNHNCSNCGRYKENCFYSNIKRLEKEKGRACPYWAGPASLLII